jgi:hypothetical protein
LVIISAAVETARDFDALAEAINRASGWGTSEWAALFAALTSGVFALLLWRVTSRYTSETSTIAAADQQMAEANNRMVDANQQLLDEMRADRPDTSAHVRGGDFAGCGRASSSTAALEKSLNRSRGTRVAERAALPRTCHQTSAAAALASSSSWRAGSGASRRLPDEHRPRLSR